MSNIAYTGARGNVRGSAGIDRNINAERIQCQQLFVTENLISPPGGSTGQALLSSSLAAANAVLIEANNVAGGIDINAGTAGIAVDTTGGISVDSSSVAVASNITTVGAAGFDLSIGSTAGSLNLTAGEAAVNAIVIDASNAAGGIDIDAGTGGIAMNVTGAADIAAVSSLGSVVLSGGEVVADAVQVTASNTAGGVTITSGATGTGTLAVNGLVVRTATAAGIGAARVLTAADSGGFFEVDKTGVYAITLPTPAQGISFTFMVLDTGANIVTITSPGAFNFGIVDVNNVNLASTGTNVLLASAGSVGDWVHYQGIDATHYLVTGACIAAADITFT